MYLATLAGQIRARVPPDDLPEEETHALFLGYAVLLLAKGEDVTAADVHNAWVAWMAGREPTHDALVRYEQLDPEAAEMDEPFVQAIRAVARQGKD
jgi:hypothetical protein